MQVTVADYIFRRVAQAGVRDVFMVSGGGIMYLCDALGRNPDLAYWCNYNEQASAYAADAYARITGGLGACLVTTGPGGSNALTGLAGAYVDSIPVLAVTGQARTQICAEYACQRQVGPQELNIVPMAAPVTKYAVTLTDPQEARYELEKCLHTALGGRPGPVLLCVPLDIQRALVEPQTLNGYLPEPVAGLADDQLNFLEEKLRQAKRPVVIAGHGVTLSGGRELFDRFLRQTGLPAVLTIGALDLLPERHPQFQGRFGPAGQRRANFAVQNADFVLALGTSLSLSCVGFDVAVAPKAEKALVNIDKGDLRCRHLDIQHRILADAKAVLAGLERRFAAAPLAVSPRWLEVCAEWKGAYGPFPASLRPAPDAVDSYAFFHQLSERLDEGDVLVAGNSFGACGMMHQNFRCKTGQRAFTSVCFGAMGADLPHALGAAVAQKGRRVFLVTGDGSFLFNVQELMTIGFHRMPVTLFVLNNDGYQSIRNTQNNYFSGRQVGADAMSGVANPDFAKLAEAFGLAYDRLENTDSLPRDMARVLSLKAPCLCEVRLSQDQPYYRLGVLKTADGGTSPRPLEDMEPLLPREELNKNMSLFEEAKV
jgi:acetolactate synthase-1/2/3 large subunit